MYMETKSQTNWNVVEQVPVFIVSGLYSNYKVNKIGLLNSYGNCYVN